jgi:hypothetical protein
MCIVAPLPSEPTAVEAPHALGHGRPVAPELDQLDHPQAVAAGALECVRERAAEVALTDLAVRE